jgi:hypothetical protein
MEKRQQARLAALASIPAFLKAHIRELGHLYLSRSGGLLCELVDELAAERDAQATAEEQRQTCTKLRQELRRAMFIRHLRPIAAITRVEFADAPEAAALRCPSSRLRDQALLVEAESIGQHAARRWRMFRRYMLPPYFVRQLRATIDAMDNMIKQADESRTRRTEATAALASAFRRATPVVAAIDALVQAKAGGNSALMAEWREVRRAQADGAAPDRAVADAA